jgi:hypothetical protein
VLLLTTGMLQAEEQAAAGNKQKPGTTVLLELLQYGINKAQTVRGGAYSSKYLSITENCSCHSAACCLAHWLTAAVHTLSINHMMTG